MTRENSNANATKQGALLSESPENVIIDYGNGYVFDAARAVDDTVEWIRDFFEDTGGKVAIIGISGGKDSSVAAALCVRALGAENVIGLKMPDGGQDDWQDQDDIIKYLSIRMIDFDIMAVTGAIQDTAAEIGIATPGELNPGYNTIPDDMWDIPNHNKKLFEQAAEADDYGIYVNDYELPHQAATNMPARVRTVVLYMIAQSLSVSARVIGTANLSEGFIGWDTRYGGCGGSGCDLLPLAQYTASEVVALGKVLGLPAHLVEKPPADGLTGKTDEDNFGFTYEQLDAYIRLGGDANVPDEVRAKIDAMHKRNEFKMHMPPACENDLPVRAGGNVSGNGNEEKEKGLLDILIPNAASPFSDRVLTKAVVPAHEATDDYGMDVTCSDGIDRRGLMAPCPNCKTAENLKIKADLACLNALEYWVECEGCGEHWTDRQLGLEYAEDEHELVEAWNEKMDGQA